MLKILKLNNIIEFVFFILFINCYSQNNKVIIEKKSHELTRKILTCFDNTIENFLVEIDWSKSYKDIFDNQKYVYFLNVNYESIKNFQSKDFFCLKAEYKNEKWIHVECLATTDENYRFNIQNCIINILK
ncbi:MAG: hypothetical protein N3F09_08850 [Bacteroidia bacterium]|nr:hypothetical protein [Bacteroidia bacterium]